MAGRPLKYKTVKALEEAIEEYFDSEPEAPSVVELALHLGFMDRSSMYNYKEREEFSYTIRRAISKIEAVHEKKLLAQSCTGSIFWLKNRGWNAEEEIKQENTNKDIDLNSLSDAELNKLIAIIGKAESGKG